MSLSPLVVQMVGGGIGGGGGGRVPRPLIEKHPPTCPALRLPCPAVTEPLPHSHPASQTIFTELAKTQILCPNLPACAHLVAYQNDVKRTHWDRSQ